MAITQNTYTGDGTTVLFSFTFPYLETTDIKVSLNGLSTTAYTLANATTVQFNTAPANGAAIRIYRETDDAALAATFYPGSAIRSNDLNENFTQNLYVTQEAINYSVEAVITADAATATANSATSTANTALSTANTASTNASAAVTTANTASTNASAAVSTANTASTNASAAVTTANSAAADAATALSTANTALSTSNTADANASTALSTANTAASDAATALSTANTASTNASAAVSTANTASSNATTAVSTANSALSTANAAASAVANAILYDIVANVAAIPGSPANNDAVEVTDSTGIESFTPLNGLPVGFVGDSGLSVRLVYTTTGSTWNWIQYFPNDPESRYGDAISTNASDIGTLQSDVTTLQGDVSTLQGDVSTVQGDVTTLQNDVLGLDNDKLNLTGGTMTGNIVFNAGQTISGYVSETGTTGSAELPVGTTAQRDATPAAGYIRFNTDTNSFEGYGTAWGSIGGGAVGGGTDAVFYENDQVVTTNYTLTTNKNAMTAGPVTIDSGVTVTVPSGAAWVVV